MALKSFAAFYAVIAFACQTSCSLSPFISLGINSKQKAPTLPKGKHVFWNKNKMSHPWHSTIYLSLKLHY